MGLICTVFGSATSLGVKLSEAFDQDVRPGYLPTAINHSAGYDRRFPSMVNRKMLLVILLFIDGLAFLDRRQLRAGLLSMSLLELSECGAWVSERIGGKTAG